MWTHLISVYGDFFALKRRAGSSHELGRAVALADALRRKSRCGVERLADELFGQHAFVIAVARVEQQGGL